MIVNGRSVYYPSGIAVPEQTQGEFEIRHRTIPRGEPLNLTTFRTALFGQRGGTLRYQKPTVWHELRERGGIWMTDLPIEQKQHDDLLRPFRGSVLVGGLGLGYAVTALARKRLVREIVVVERSQEVIDLVWPYTRHHGKARVVCEDLFVYLDRLDAHTPFHWGFYDIWQGDGETTFHETVVPLLQKSRGKVIHIQCWNEDVMRGQLLMGLRNRLMFLKHDLFPLGGSREEMLEKLSTPNGSVWTDWAAPFWARVRAYPEYPWDAWDTEARAYASMYGRI